MGILWGVRQLKKIDLRTIFLIFGFGRIFSVFRVVFCVFWFSDFFLYLQLLELKCSHWGGLVCWHKFMCALFSWSLDFWRSFWILGGLFGFRIFWYFWNQNGHPGEWCWHIKTGLFQRWFPNILTIDKNEISENWKWGLFWTWDFMANRPGVSCCAAFSPAQATAQAGQ